MALSHNTLKNYYEITFALMQHHSYSLAEIENMMPWERDLYVGMLIQYLEKKKAEQE